LGEGAEVSNLGLKTVNVTGAGDYVGGLVGQSAGNISTSYSKGTVTGDWHVGGLVGCQGIGDLMRGILVNCCSSGKVGGNNGVGGLAGSNNGQIVGSYSVCSVNGTGAYTGGLVGNNWGIITVSYSTGNISGKDDVGGFVGRISYGSITMSYSTGKASGNEHVGGFAGYHDFGTIVTSFWDIDTSSLTNMCGDQGFFASGCDNVYGRPTSEMQASTTFLDAGWDFVDETANGPNDIWKMIEGQTYPLLSWQKYSGGTGDPNPTFTIK